MKTKVRFTKDDLSKVRKALTLIERDCVHDVSIKKLCIKVNLPPRILQQGVPLLKGFSIHRYVLEIRAQLAIQYLSDFSLTVKDISAMCGFGNTTIFINNFKRSTGLRPGQFRTAHLVNSHKTGAKRKFKQTA